MLAKEFLAGTGTDHSQLASDVGVNPNMFGRWFRGESGTRARTRARGRLGYEYEYDYEYGKCVGTLRCAHWHLLVKSNVA
jgi:hypothetical protein